MTVSASGHVYEGEVCVIVNPMRNPFIEIRRSLGRVKNINIPKPRGDYMPLRPHESYVVRSMHNGFSRYYWPTVASMRLANG